MFSAGPLRPFCGYISTDVLPDGKEGSQRFSSTVICFNMFTKGK